MLSGTHQNRVRPMPHNPTNGNFVVSANPRIDGLRVSQVEQSARRDRKAHARNGVLATFLFGDSLREGSAAAADNSGIAAAQAANDDVEIFGRLRKWYSVIAKVNTKESRYALHNRVRLLESRKTFALRGAVFLGMLSMIILVVHMELRLQDVLDDDTRYNGVCDVLRGVECGLTVGLLWLIAFYYSCHHHILALIGSSRIYRSGPMFALLELLPLILGVLPPGIDGTVLMWRNEQGELYGEVERHVDTYCLLQFGRVALIAKWVTVLLLSHVKSPAVLGWEHRLPLNNAFRFKYVQTRHPMRLVSAFIMSTWLTGAFTLHCLEPTYVSLWTALYDGWILMLDAPPSKPLTIVGDVIVMAMSLVGALCLALVTASLTTAAELSTEEAWLVRKIETQEELRKRERCALQLMQACVRVWIEFRRVKKEGAAADASGPRHGQLVKHQRAQKEAAAAFKHVSGHVSQLTRVHNLAVIHNGVDDVRAEQSRLAHKLENLMRLNWETARSVQSIARRIDNGGGVNDASVSSTPRGPEIVRDLPP